MLPDALQQRFALDDVVAITADPEVAREDGAVLLLPGHPVLDGAASSAVQHGDAGVAWLPWPGRRPPGTSELLDRAREAVGVDHGRIDRDQEAARAWLPVLPAGCRALPMLEGRLPTVWTLGPEVADRLFARADPPIRLDPVAEALWWSARPIAGLPLVVRCLTAWWRIHDDLDLDAEPAVLAAALTSLVENRSGMRRSRAEAAADHAVSTERAATAARRLQRRLELSSQRPW